MFSDEDCSDSDDWIFNSIQKYDELLMFEFQGKVSSASFQSPETLIAACKNTSGRNEILKLSVPDRLLAKKDVGLVKNRDFNVVAAGYLKNEASCVVPLDNMLITSEFEGIHLYDIPNVENSDLITHSLCLRNLTHPQISFETLQLISGSNLGNIKSHSVETSKEVNDFSNIIESSNLEASNPLSYLKCYSNNLVIGCRDNGLLLHVDIRSRQHRLIELNKRNSVWSYSLSSNEQNVCFVNSSGCLYLYDVRNLSKEVNKLIIDHGLCEENGAHLNVQFDPSNSFISVSGFDACINVYSVDLGSSNVSTRFSHDGHKKNNNHICGHVWHPSLPNVIFSFDKNGTLQAWKFR